MIRRIRRVIGERARAVHPDLQPASYLMLAYLADHGPLRASGDRRGARASTRARSAASSSTSWSSAWSTAPRTPTTAARRWSRPAPTPCAGSTTSPSDRRQWLDERLGDWTDEELAGFAEVLGRYNAALDGGA